MISFYRLEGTGRALLAHHMLPAYIIEELRRREDARREQERRPTLDLPLPIRPAPFGDDQRSSTPRGVLVIDLMG